MRDLRRAVYLVVAVGLAVGGCSTNGVDVIQYGEIRQVLREGHTEPRIDLSKIVRVPHAYAVGALENLDGEITVVDGDVWVARKSGDELNMTGPAVVTSDRATLLSLSYVAKWTSVQLLEPMSGSGLESGIQKLAREHGVDTANPFPFVIDGKITRLEGHVIAGSCPFSGKPGGTKPWRLSLDRPAEATLVGFFATDQAGIMTHHGSSVHMHVIMRRAERIITAHVEQVAVAAGSVLRLPS